MNCLSQVYRQACREIELPVTEKALFLKLLRELSVNAVRRQDETAMANLLQDSEKLDNEIADLVSKFGVNVALFKES